MIVDHLRPFVPFLDVLVRLEHLHEPLLGLLRFCPLAFSQLAQPALEHLLLLSFRLAKVAEARIFRVCPLEVGEVSTGGGDGREKESAVSGQRL